MSVTNGLHHTNGQHGVSHQSCGIANSTSVASDELSEVSAKALSNVLAGKVLPSRPFKATNGDHSNSLASKRANGAASRVVGGSKNDEVPKDLANLCECIIGDANSEELTAGDTFEIVIPAAKEMDADTVLVTVDSIDDPVRNKADKYQVILPGRISITISRDGKTEIIQFKVKVKHKSNKEVFVKDAYKRGSPLYKVFLDGCGQVILRFIEKLDTDELSVNSRLIIDEKSTSFFNSTTNELQIQSSGPEIQAGIKELNKAFTTESPVGKRESMSLSEVSQIRVEPIKPTDVHEKIAGGLGVPAQEVVDFFGGDCCGLKLNGKKLLWKESPEATVRLVSFVEAKNIQPGVVRVGLCQVVARRYVDREEYENALTWYKETLEKLSKEVDPVIRAKNIAIQAKNCALCCEFLENYFEAVMYYELSDKNNPNEKVKKFIAEAKALRDDKSVT